MPNPLIGQGFLNRVRGSASFTDIPDLNVTASFLGSDGISLRPDTSATDIIPTMAGTVGSVAPYQQVTLTLNLLRTQTLATAFQNRFATNTALGEVVVSPDSTTLANYTVLNAHLVNFNELSFAGQDAGYVVTISGYIVVNNDMWDIL